MFLRKCYRCGKTLSASAFSKNDNNNKRHYHLEGCCKKCNSNSAKNKLADRRDLNNYGVTISDLMENYGPNCNICLTPLIDERGELIKEQNGKRLAVIDHCHTTHRVRAPLCRKCNLVIGFSQDNPETLRRAAIYCEMFN